MSEMQKARVLSLLLAHRGEWVSSVDLSRLSLQYNARIFSLRRDGWEIESRVERVGGRHGAKHGFYRIQTPRQAAAAKVGAGVALTQADRDAAAKDESQPSLFSEPLMESRHRDDG